MVDDLIICASSACMTTYTEVIIFIQLALLLDDVQPTNGLSVLVLKHRSPYLCLCFSLSSRWRPSYGGVVVVVVVVQVWKLEDLRCLTQQRRGREIEIETVCVCVTSTLSPSLSHSHDGSNGSVLEVLLLCTSLCA